MSNKKWVILFSIIILLSLLSALVVWFSPSEDSVAVITVSGVEVRRIHLADVDAPYQFELNGKNGTNTIRVAKNQIEMIDASCPDQLCVHHGPLKNRLSPIVCLPNEVVITFSDDSANDIDAISQ